MNTVENLKKLNQHITVMKRTESSVIDTSQTRLVHASSGLINEYFELLKVRRKAFNTGKYDRPGLIEELGDMIWYLCLGIDALSNNNIDITFFSLNGIVNEIIEGPMSVDNIDDILDDVWIDSMDYLSEILKAALFYNRPFDVKRFLDCLGVILFGIYTIALQFDFKLETICDTNKKKLETRYPDKFTITAANNRNLQEERKQLEQID